MWRLFVGALLRRRCGANKYKCAQMRNGFLIFVPLFAYIYGVRSVGRVWPGPCTCMGMMDGLPRGVRTV